MQLPSRHTGPWTLADLSTGRLGTPKHGLKVFSCFACGGGSSLGYKLAGFDVLGICEIDPQMARIYRANHQPKLVYEMPIQDMVALPDERLDPALFDLDILDGSPPCSVFSMAGSREKKWGSEHAFREGQATQRLDDLFFVFIRLAARIRPKLVVAENVKGMLAGNARGYCKEIFDAFSLAGYETQLFLLCSSRMGVPQRRERTFFVARRMDLAIEKARMDFDEPEIGLMRALRGTTAEGAKPMSEKARPHWQATKMGGLFSMCGAGSGKLNRRTMPSKPSWTLTSSASAFHWGEARAFSPSELVRIQSFPDDYDFGGQQAQYVCGMSVPPLMTQRVALECARVLLDQRLRSTRP